MIATEDEISDNYYKSDPCYLVEQGFCDLDGRPDKIYDSQYPRLYTGAMPIN